MRADGRHGARRFALLAGLVVMLIAALAPAPAAAQSEPRFRALLFTKTAAFRHDSIPAGVAAVQELAAANNFTVDHTEDSTQFNDANLANYDVVIWLNTTGDVLNDTEQGAFERYIQAGGGYAGVHSAADTEYDWAWYGDLMGAYFQSHPAIQEATVKVADRAHPATQHLPARWVRTDEWYNFRTNPRENVHVLAALDETSYDPGSGAMGFDHPIAWCQDFDGGRSFYTGLGHTSESFSESAYRQHLLAGLETAAGVTPADCGATVSSNFEKVALDQNTSDPFELDVAPDGRVFFVERGGDVKIHRPDTQSTVTAGHIDVFTGQENGLLGIALDPAFATNGWAYLFYAATGDVGCPAADPGATTCGPLRLSRFTVNGNSLDPASEQVLLEFPIQRDQCCHSSGSLDFDAQGNLYLTTGDNTNPFGSSGYTPTDEREGRSSWDAQRTSANTNDHRGKVLRIHPEPDGSYTIPAGNLFAPFGAMGTRPEIYAMGFRNPFRMTVDPETGWVYVADYGPDATAPDATRGPAGYVEWNQIRAAGNYGWPYCHGNQFAYNDYDFATGTSGALFDCTAPVNESPNNTGLTQLPPSRPPNVWYSYGLSAEFPELGTGCGCPMAGPVYHFDPDLQSERKFPAYFDDTPFFFEWGRNFIKEFKQDESGELLDIYPFLPTETYLRPMDMAFGPDGAMYVLEWGSGFGGANPDSGLYRIDYVKGTRRPIVTASATPDSGAAPLTVQFSSEGTRDPDEGDQITYAWDFESDGTVDSTEPHPSHTYTTAGNYTARLTVTDTSGKTGVANLDISAGNTRPTVTIDAPPDGGFFDFGDDVAYSVSVNDPEDGTDCASAQMEFILGHDEHGHPLAQQTGCEGTIQTASDAGHGATANLFGVLEATYTDQGAPGVAPLTGRAQVLLQPKRKQAEHFTQNQGVQLESTSDEGGGQNIGFIDNGDYISFKPMNLLNIDSLVYRAASAGAGGTIEVHVDSPSGPLISTATITPTGGWQRWTSVEAAITAPGGTHELFFVFKSDAGGGLFNLNWIEFVGKGVSVNATPRVSASADPVRGEVPLTVDFAATAADPENDPVTFAWDFGDGGSATGANVSHTYETSGTFTAKVTGTDSGGRSSTDTVQVQVVPLGSPPIECTDPDSDPGRDDEFDGDRLDGCRWDAVVRPDHNGFRVEGGLLKIDTTPTNLFDQHNNAPNLMLQTWPYDDWTVEAKVVAPVSERYQQAGILVYLSDATFLKFDVVGTSDPGVHPANRVIEIRHEIGDEFQPDFPEAQVPHTPGDVYYLRLQKRGSEYTGFYSLDGTTWRQLADPVVNTALAGADVGVYGFGQEQTTSTTVGFDYFHLVESSVGPTVTASATPTRGNAPLAVEFSGSSTYGDGEATYAWDFGDGASAEGLNATHTYTEPGTYTATLTATDTAGGTSSDSAEIEVTAPCTTPSEPEAGYRMLFDGTNESLTNWKQAGPGHFEHDGCTIKSVGGLGLFWYDQDQEFNAPYSLKLEWMMPGDDNSGVFVGFPDPGDDPFVAVNQGEEIQIDATDDPDSTTGAIYNEQAPDAIARDAALNPPGEWNEYEIRVEADRIIVYLNGVKINEWIDDDPNVDLATGYIGVQNHGSDDVFFRSIRISDDTTPPETTATLSPGAPDGENGWYVSPVEVTLDATDEGSGVASTEYRVNGGSWTDYTGPFEVGEDGAHLIDFRSTDEARNVEEAKSAVIKIDGTAPEVTCAATPDRLSPPDRRLRDVTVDLHVTDATSGAAGFTLVQVTSNEPDSPVPGDIQGWDIGTADTTGKLRAERSGPGMGRVYTITYEGRDEAGNTAGCQAEVTVPKRGRPGA
ncbi:MAG: ThuA domain-containing protein [Thermoleophilaceae bacterium]